MPFIRKKDFENLKIAGIQMSNICFNLGQYSGHIYDVAIVKSAQESWDAAIIAVEKSFKNK
jgi:hypothetical protein